MADGLHNLIIESRNRTVVSGVCDVGGFDDKSICMYTSMGRLIVHGTQLHILKMSVETGDVIFEGTVNSLEHSDKQSSKNDSFLKKLFR